MKSKLHVALVVIVAFALAFSLTLVFVPVAEAALPFCNCVVHYQGQTLYGVVIDEECWIVLCRLAVE